MADKHEAEPGNVTPMSPQLETTHRRASLLTCETLGALFENKTSATQRAYFLSAAEMRPSSSYVGGVEILKQATGNAGRSTQQPRPSGFVPTLKYQTHQEPANESSMPCLRQKEKYGEAHPTGCMAHLPNGRVLLSKACLIAQPRRRSRRAGGEPDRRQRLPRDRGRIGKQKAVVGGGGSQLTEEY